MSEKVTSKDTLKKNQVKRRTRKLKVNKTWILDRDFDSATEAEDVIKSEGCWSHKFTNRTNIGTKKYFRCKQVKRNGPQCTAEIQLHYDTVKSRVSLLRTESKHTHDKISNKKKGLTVSMQSQIENMFEDGLKPKEMFERLITNYGSTANIDIINVRNYFTHLFKRKCVNNGTTTNNNKCRLCDAKTQLGIHINGEQGIQLSILNILTEYFPELHLSENDTDSKICKYCWRTIDQFHKLRLLVRDNGSRHLLSLRESSGTDIQSPECIDCNVKDEYDAYKIDAFESSDNYPSPIPGDEVSDRPIKMEVDFGEQLETNDNNKIVKESGFTIDNLDSTSKEETWNEKETEKKRKCIKNISKQQLEFQRQDREINKFITMICDICNETMATYSNLLKHFLANHKITGYVKCCNKKYFRRKQLYDHVIHHNNPDKYKCEQCEKQYVTNDRLKRHQLYHDPMSRKYQCTVCPKRFMASSSLQSHFQRTHKDLPKTFLCDICNRSFVSKPEISSHMSRIHAQKYVQMCEVCAKVYPTKRLLDYHYKKSHMKIVLPKIQCKVCGAWLANIRGLRRHTILHKEHRETCNICGKIAPNKHALRGHIRYAHNTNVFKCNVCEKIFKSARTLKEHLGSHTGTFLYKCQYCLLEFNSSGNMYNHRKKAHPIELQKEREEGIKGSVQTYNENKTI